MARTYKALAFLLRYPDPDLQALAVDAMAVIEAEALVPSPIRRGLAKLASGLATGDLLDLQERYVDLFDRTRSLSLNLYEHVHGESRDRGQAMVALLELYRSNGLDLCANEQPDFLRERAHRRLVEPVALVVPRGEIRAHVRAERPQM